MVVYKLDDDVIHACSSVPRPGQVYTDHLARFGAKEIPRSEYLQMLAAALKDLS